MKTLRMEYQVAQPGAELTDKIQTSCMLTGYAWAAMACILRNRLLPCGQSRRFYCQARMCGQEMRNYQPCGKPCPTRCGWPVRVFPACCQAPPPYTPGDWYRRCR